MVRVKHRGRVGLGSLFLLALTPLIARALVAAPPPGPVRFTQADVVFVGRVVGLETKDVQAPPFPGVKQSMTYRIAVVKVNESIKGPKDGKTIRLAFIPRDNTPKAPILIRPAGMPSPTFEVGQEGLFLLTKHFQEDFYMPPIFYQFVSSQAPNFAKDKAEAVKVASLLVDADASLKSTDAEDRFLTAAVLVAMYRQPRPMVGVVGYNGEPIAAGQSKLILKALAEADWKKAVKFGEIHPWSVFSQLGLSAKDGWQPPTQVKKIEDVYQAAQTWLTEHGDYRIQKLVPTFKK